MSDLIKLSNQVDLFDLPKVEIRQLAAKLVNQTIESGEEDILPIHIKLRKLKELIDTALSETEYVAMQEYEREGHKTLKINGNTSVTKRNGYDKFDYDQDIVYKEKKDELDARKKELHLVATKGVELYDDQGIQVPRVQVKGSTKDSLTINF